MKKRLSAFLVLVIIFQLFQSLTASAVKLGDTTISAAGACVMDYDTGEIYFEHNGNTPRVPASMTKIMNVYCVYEALARGEITLNTVVPISKNVYDKSRNSVYQSVLPLYYNQTYTVDELLSVVVTYSASGAAVALAELVGGGSEAAFVDRMNQKVAQMGIDAFFFDSCGIAKNEMSPIAMATLARNIIRDYPDILVRSSKPSVRFHGNTYKTTNHLLDTYYYSGADGLKTGTTSAAGYCFCGTAVRNGKRMISVVMSSSSTGQRFVDTARLLDYGFKRASENPSASPDGYFSSAPITKKRSILYTDMRVFMNGHQMPTYVYVGEEESHAVIKAEDLAYYGFDVSYDAATHTLYLKRNPQKPIVPLNSDILHVMVGAEAFTIIDAPAKVIIDDGVSKHEPEDIYNVNGYICLSVDEFEGIYDFAWNGNDRTINITATNKPVPSESYAPTDAPAPEVKPSEPAIPEKEPEKPLEETLTSQSAFIMDYHTGNELFAKDADTQRPVASIAKMMSVYVLLDAVKNGELSLDTVVPISENVYNLSRNPDFKMMVNLEYDQTYTLNEMIDMIVIDSAAACVTACAELLCGTEREFAERMNKKAQEIGIGSVFYNGTGVPLNPDTENKENLMSAREIAIMTQKMIADYPEILERTKCASVEFHGNKYYNLNKLFTDFYYKGADGFKNGMTEASGYCMCGTAEIDGKRVITVSLPSASNEARFTDTIQMFDYGLKKLGADVTNATVKPESGSIPNGANVKIVIDGNYEMKFSDQQPVIMNDRTLIPIRELMETLEKKVEWDAASQQVIISDEVTKVYLQINKDIMIKEVTNPLDGNVTREEVKLEVAPIVINSRTCLPLYAVVEAFGAAVIWEAETSTILIIAGVC
ncbi:MAG: hypothetical protein E7417_01910 [Ruminococcaceae bacterium]|nr:hypothetical protein [Oscillospiraceae bacterium]